MLIKPESVEKDELGALAESMDTLSDKLVEAEEFREDLETEPPGFLLECIA